MKNDKAVSPVIGVILMVAITVILAAAIAAVVFGMSGNLSSHPAPFYNGEITVKSVHYLYGPLRVSCIVLSSTGLTYGVDEISDCVWLEMMENSTVPAQVYVTESGHITRVNRTGAVA